MSQPERQTSESYSASRPSPTDYQRLYNAVFGDGFNWDGIVEQLKGIKREVEKLNGDVGDLSHSVRELVRDVESVRNEVNSIKNRIGAPSEVGTQARALLWTMTVALVFLVMVTLWPLILRLFA